VAAPRFYRSMGIAATAVAIIGFVPGLVRSNRLGPITPMVAWHGALGAAWLALYLVQTTLIGRGSREQHRRLGFVGIGLAITFAVTGYAVAIAQTRRGFDLSGDLHIADDPLAALVFPLGDLVSFSVLVGLATRWRRRPDRHKRLILLATVVLMAAPLAHVIGQVPALQAFPPVILLPLAAFYFAAAIHDRWTDGRVHPISLWGAITLLVWAQGRAVLVGPSEAWHRFAAWLIA
jgi:uncharacterized membrane protein YozB (DUF420 family)